MAKEGSALARAYAFLFDGSVESVPEPRLSFFTAAVLGALAQADPQGKTRAQLRMGLPGLHAFAERTTAVRGAERSSGWTISHSVDIYKTVVWEWLDSLVHGWSSIDREYGQEIFRLHCGECIALSALRDETRDKVDQALKLIVPGYVGSFEIDPGNPLHRKAFFDSLIHAADIVDGAVVQERSFEGDEEWAPEGATEFMPRGLVWKDFGWHAEEGPPGLPCVGLSERGRRSAANVGQKQARSVEERVLEEIASLFIVRKNRINFEFEAVGKQDDVLQAVMPEGKFTKYLFNRAHPKGGSKASFIIDELGIVPEDWRYLAAQFYLALLIAQPAAVQLVDWQGGYGARFNILMRVRGRSGNKAVLVTGWSMEPGKLPSLSTAFPGQRDAEAVEPDEPPILPPGARTDTDWAQLWSWASTAGEQAGTMVVPTPMYIVGFEPEAEGECGGAAVRVPDARKGLARWLVRQGVGETDGKGGAVIFCPLATQSLDRATAWARTVAMILQLNGIGAEVETYQS